MSGVGGRIQGVRCPGRPIVVGRGPTVWIHCGLGARRRRVPHLRALQGREEGAAGTTPELPQRLGLARRPAVHGLRDRRQPDSAERPGVSWPRHELLWEYPAEKRSGALGPSSRLGSVGDSRQGEGSQVAVELWRMRAKPDSPGLGAALVRNPLELTDRVSACTLLCQGTAAGVE